MILIYTQTFNNMKIIGIYKIQSKIKPDRIYIGSSIDIRRRWNKHRSDLNTNNHKSIKLQNHYNKYGLDDLEFSIILKECKKEELIFLEQIFIDIYNPYFNCLRIAGSILGYKHTQKHLDRIKGNKFGCNNKGIKKKITDNYKGNKNSCGNHKDKGIKKSEEAKLNMKKAWQKRKLIPVSDITKDKLKRIIICPHCGKYGGISAMHHWHFDNCKKKLEINA